MKKVNAIPAIERSEVRRDPWIDSLLDGELYELDRSDWSGRYKTPRSGASAIREGGKKRGIEVTTAVRGDSLYVRAELSAPQKLVRKVNGKAPAKATTVRKSTATKGAPRKAAAKKAVPQK